MPLTHSIDIDSNKSKVKLLGGLKMLLNIIQTQKGADMRLRMAAGAAIINICDGDGKGETCY